MIDRDAPRILVTGADGFLGRHVAALLTEGGYRVIAAGRQERLLDEDQNGTIFRRCGTTTEDLRRHLQGCDVAVHLATSYGRQDESVERMLESNVVLPVRIAELAAAERVPLLLADTFYSKPGVKYEHLRLYTESKRACFKICQTLMWDCAALIRMHIEHLYGPGDRPDKAIPSLVARIVNGESQIDLTDATQRRDFIHVKDAARAIYRLVTAVPGWEPVAKAIDIGTGQATSLRYVLETVKHLSGSDSLLAFGVLPTRPGEPSVSRADTAVLSEVGWCPQIDLDAGLKELVLESGHRV